MAKKIETVRRNEKIYRAIKDGVSIQTVAKMYGLSERTVMNIDKAVRSTTGELHQRGRKPKVVAVETIITETPRRGRGRPKKVVVAPEAPVMAAASPESSDAFVSGKHYVLYHVKRRLPKDNYNIIGKLVTRHEDVKRLMKLGLPKTKAEFLAPYINETVKVTEHSDEYDYTLAAGYRPDMKALVVTYARPDYSMEDFDVQPRKGLIKRIRRQGFSIASGRIKKAISGAHIVMTDIENASSALNRHVLKTMTEYVHKAFKFFKDKKIESIYMFTPDNRLVLLETASE